MTPGQRNTDAKDVDHDHVAPEIIVARDERPPFAADLRDRKIRGCCADRKAEVKASADLEQDHHQKLIRKTTYRRYTVSLLIYEGDKSSLLLLQLQLGDFELEQLLLKFSCL